jgi:autotransporter-associated beta strand protein
VDATANTLTIVTGTTTISSEVSGGTGLTKAGSGTLALSGAANTYGGGTLLNTGTLQIAALGSLGTGKVTFGGGTLQYPAGSGASSIDVSGKVETVASGQVAKIDTDGNDVTFATAIGGEGGLTKLGGGSLTLAATNTYTGPTTVSAGTLNLSSASGTIATLDVPVGGTVNLGAGAAVNILNVTGGTVNITGAGVQVDTLFASSGIIDASANALAVANSASLSGTTFTRSGASPLSLSGSNLVAPTSVSHTTLAADGGTLSLVATGLDAAIGKGAPGIPALPATATFSGSGAWALNGGLVQSFNNDVYGDDNHAFHYIQVPSGDFDIKVHVTAVANARAGLMARDNLVSRYDSHAGASAVIWTGASATTIGGVMSATNITTPGNPWLKITRVGDIVTTYYSSDDIDYTQDKQQDYTASPWGETTYLGLDMTDTTSLPGTASATYEGVNFMGTASMPDLSTTELVLRGGAVVNVECPVKLAKLTIGGVVQPVGTYDATTTPLAISGAGSITIGTIVPVSDYDTWALGFFPTPGDPNALATADPDMDGMTNHKEYAFGLKPNDAASANPITAPLHKVSGQFSYTRRATPTTTGLAYSVWTSTDLVTWALDAGAAESITTSGDIQMVTVTVSASLLTGAQMFVRVQTQ